jgi:hypothetical protein
MLALGECWPEGDLTVSVIRLDFAKLPTRVCLTLIWAALMAFEPGTTRAEDSIVPWCPRCNLLVGVGATYQLFGWSDGVVVPVTLELDQSRWGLGGFRFTNAQRYDENDHATSPYWGLTAMRRWQVLHRSPVRLYLGFGGNYRSELDYLESTRWNFAYLVAVRFDLDSHGRLLELGIRHWSDFWLKQPNRGQDFFTVSFGF